MNMQNRFRSVSAWSSLIPVIVVLGDTFGLWNIIGMPKETATQLLASICAILVTFGVFNNPTDGNHF